MVSLFLKAAEKSTLEFDSFPLKIISSKHKQIFVKFKYVH